MRVIGPGGLGLRRVAGFVDETDLRVVLALVGVTVADDHRRTGGCRGCGRPLDDGPGCGQRGHRLRRCDLLLKLEVVAVGEILRRRRRRRAPKRTAAARTLEQQAVGDKGLARCLEAGCVEAVSHVLCNCLGQRDVADGCAVSRHPGQDRSAHGCFIRREHGPLASVIVRRRAGARWPRRCRADSA